MEGKKAVVVGAGQQPGDLIGNGHAITTLLAREGAEVCAVDIAEDRARLTASEIVAEGGSAHVIMADITHEADCTRLIEDARAAMGRIDALINVVGYRGENDNLFGLEERTWQKTIDANLRYLWWTCRAVVPIMQEQGGGVITNISSILSKQGSGGFAYTVAKAGVNAVTHLIAEKFASSGIRCNVVLPGFVATPRSMEGMFTEGTTLDAVMAQRAQMVPLGRVGTAWDIAHAVLYLSSDDAGFITGLEVPVDGGITSIVGPSYEQFAKDRT